MIISAYRFMWVLAMFDLPTVTKKQKKAYTTFRKGLLEDGFSMMQYSVYVRHCPNKENAEVHVSRIKAAMPEEGEIRVILFTDKQFEKMRLFVGTRQMPLEQPAGQLEIF